MATLKDLRIAATQLLTNADTRSRVADFFSLDANTTPDALFSELLQAQGELPAKLATARKSHADATAQHDAAATVLAKDAVARLERLANFIEKLTILAAEVGDLEAAMAEESQRTEAAKQSAWRRGQADQQAAIERCNAHRSTVEAFASVDTRIHDLAGAVRKAWDTALSASPTMNDKDFDRMVDRAFGALRHVVLHHLGFLPGVGSTIPADQAIFAGYAPAKPMVTPAAGWDGGIFKPGGEYEEYVAGWKPAN